MLSQRPAKQIDGCATDTTTWNRRVIQPSTWQDPLRSDPPQIIKQFEKGRYTQGLALAVSWGGMARHPERIYNDGSPETIERIESALSKCADEIRASHSIDRPWKILTGKGNEELGWSAVMASKTLHFLCRALGYLQNPPVPIDGIVIRGRLWPFFRYSFPFGQCLGNWDSDEFEAYCRYMTAIRTWADQRHWTTIEMEATIFKHFAQS